MSLAELRAARVAENQEKLRQLELHTARQGLHAVDAAQRAAKAAARAAAAEARRKRAGTAGTGEDAPLTPVRRSARSAGKAPDYGGEVVDQFGLDPDKAAREAVRRRRLAEGGPGALRTRNRRRPGAVIPQLTAEQRASLDGVPSAQWLVEFEDFLLDVLGNSHQNVRSVVKQVTKLATGQGIAHPHSRKPGWVLRHKVRCGLGHDWHSVEADGKAWEDDHGEDAGHGWLVNHPARKMQLFQNWRHGRTAGAGAAGEGGMEKGKGKAGGST